MGAFKLAQWSAGVLWVIATAVLVTEIIMEEPPHHIRSALVYLVALAGSTTLVATTTGWSTRSATSVRSAFRMGESIGWRMGFQAAREEQERMVRRDESA